MARSAQDRADLTAVDRQGNGVLAVVPAPTVVEKMGGYTKMFGLRKMLFYNVRYNDIDIT